MVDGRETVAQGGKRKAQSAREKGESKTEIKVARKGRDGRKGEDQKARLSRVAAGNRSP